MDKLSLAPSPPVVDAEETGSAPAPEHLSAAAKQLGCLPRRGARRWSGWLTDDVRGYRNMPVEIPGGKTVFVFGVLRRRVVYTDVPNGLVGDVDGVGTRWGVVWADQVQIIRNEHAVALGRCKAGVKEAFSPRKAEAARLNGAMPARAGSRPRGRPRSARQAVTVGCPILGSCGTA